MIKVLITDPISENGIKILKDQGIEVHYNPDSDLNNIKEAEEFFTWTQQKNGLLAFHEMLTSKREKLTFSKII